MYVTRYKPFRGAGEVRRSADLLSTLMNNLDISREESVLSQFVPAVNTREGEFAYHIEIDLPGISKEDIEITTEDNVLMISGERKLNEETKEEDYYLCESSFGVISRSFVLPEGIDEEKIDARYEDGRLYVTLEKEEARKAKSISVN